MSEATTGLEATFRKYDHVERYGHPDTEGIDIGRVHVFPKLDGTNASAWIGADGLVDAASRRRRITPEDDNAGFAAWVQSDECGRAEVLRSTLESHPNWILYGEWLVPHTLKTYRGDAWRRFWIFDVYDREMGRYVAYEQYSPALSGLDLIEPLFIVTNPSEQQIRGAVESNTYLILDGQGAGEGIVLKNYDWSNKYGRQPWAKIVRNEFREENRRAFGTAEKNGSFQVEAAIAEEFVTPALVDKTRAKIRLDIANETSASPDHVEHVHRGRVIPQLLGRVFHDIVAEETWGFIKKHKNPTVDFKRLRSHVTERVKACASDLFA